MNEAWTFEHSVECSVSREFAWNFWTEVSNWAFDADIESVTLEGPFRAGTHGVTLSRSSGRIEWRIAALAERRMAVIEFPAPGATGRFVWMFDNAGERTRITQRASLSGEEAASYAKAMGPGLEQGIPAGMRQLCARMEAAASATQP